jgi:hypothetical protein
MRGITLLGRQESNKSVFACSGIMLSHTTLSLENEKNGMP